jgi:hypothetical protein
MRKRTTPDDRAGTIAARHHGLITTSQAEKCGLTSTHLTRRVRTGRWDRLERGVFRIRGAPPSPAQATYAAILAAGGGAMASGLSALALYAVSDAPIVPQITVAPTASARSKLAVVRRSPVDRVDRTTVGPIPSTTPARALLESAALVSKELLDGFVDDVICRGLATPSSIVGAIRRAKHGPGRAGAPQLRRSLEPWLVGIQPGSPAEVRLLRRIADWGLPAPVRQYRVELDGGRTAYLDLAWPDLRVGLEYDGAASHTPRRLPSDVAREEALRRLGWWIGRVDRHDLQPSSTRVRDELVARLLGLAA